ncbi:MAG: PD-(D/E)XK nuclease family protein [Chlamydiales bacterium]
MTSKYNEQRSRNLFRGDERKPFKLSRSKIQDFLDCARCFYLDRRCGTDQPPGFSFTLNKAVDALYKKEFDVYRVEGKPHPLFIKHGIDAVPFAHPNLNEWRENFKGVQYFHQPSNFIVTGAVDDLWINSAGELIVADYKATSTSKEISLDEEYRQSLKNQLEIYQWLLKKNGFRVSQTGYFVYCNADAGRESFEGRLEFNISLLPYVGNDSWIEGTLLEIRKCLEADAIPAPTESCNFCKYWAAVKKHVEPTIS